MTCAGACAQDVPITASSKHVCLAGPVCLLAMWEQSRDRYQRGRNVLVSCTSWYYRAAGPSSNYLPHGAISCFTSPLRILQVITCTCVCPLEPYPRALRVRLGHDAPHHLPHAVWAPGRVTVQLLGGSQGRSRRQSCN